MEKVCTRCKAQKLVSEFNAKQSKCKDCQVDYNRQKRREQREGSSIQTDDQNHVKRWLVEQSEENLVDKIADLTSSHTTHILEKLNEIQDMCEKNCQDLHIKINNLEKVVRHKTNTVKLFIGILLVRVGFSVFIPPLFMARGSISSHPIAEFM